MYYLNRKAEKISKGYRLKPSTHRLVFKIQAMLGSNQDMVISCACRKYYNELVKKEKYNNNKEYHP